MALKRPPLDPAAVTGWHWLVAPPCGSTRLTLTWMWSFTPATWQIMADQLRRQKLVGGELKIVEVGRTSAYPRWWVWRTSPGWSFGICFVFLSNLPRVIILTMSYLLVFVWWDQQISVLAVAWVHSLALFLTSPPWRSAWPTAGSAATTPSPTSSIWAALGGYAWGCRWGCQWLWLWLQIHYTGMHPRCKWQFVLGCWVPLWFGGGLMFVEQPIPPLTLTTRWTG